MALDLPLLYVKVTLQTLRMCLLGVLALYTLNASWIANSANDLQRLLSDTYCPSIRIGQDLAYNWAGVPVAVLGKPVEGNYYKVEINLSSQIAQTVTGATFRNLRLVVNHLNGTLGSSFAFQALSSTLFVNCVIQQTSLNNCAAFGLAGSLASVVFESCRFALEVANTDSPVYGLARDPANTAIRNCSFNATISNFGTASAASFYFISYYQPPVLQSICVQAKIYGGQFGGYYVFQRSNASATRLQNMQLDFDVQSATLSWNGIYAEVPSDALFQNISFHGQVIASAISAFNILFVSKAGNIAATLVVRNITGEITSMASSSGIFQPLAQTIALQNSTTLDNITIKAALDGNLNLFSLVNQIVPHPLEITNCRMDAVLKGQAVTNAAIVWSAFQGSSAQSVKLENVNMRFSGAGRVHNILAVSSSIGFAILKNITLTIDSQGQFANAGVLYTSARVLYEDVYFYCTVGNIVKTPASASTNDVFRRYLVKLTITAPSAPEFNGIASKMTDLDVSGFSFTSNLAQTAILALGADILQTDPGSATLYKGVANAFVNVPLAFSASFFSVKSVRLEMRSTGLTDHRSGLLYTGQKCVFEYISVYFEYESNYYAVGGGARFSGVCSSCTNSVFANLQVVASFKQTNIPSTFDKPSRYGGICAYCLNAEIRTAQIQFGILLNSSTDLGTTRYQYAAAAIASAGNQDVIIKDVYYEFRELEGADLTGFSCSTLIALYDNSQLVAQGLAGTVTIVCQFGYIIDASPCNCDQLPLNVGEPGSYFPGQLIKLKNFVCRRFSSALSRKCNVNSTTVSDVDLLNATAMAYFRVPAAPPCTIFDRELAEQCTCAAGAVCSVGSFCASRDRTCNTPEPCGVFDWPLSKACKCGSEIALCPFGRQCSSAGVCKTVALGACKSFDAALDFPCICYGDTSVCPIGSFCATSSMTCKKVQLCTEAPGSPLAVPCYCIAGDNEPCHAGESCDSITRECIPGTRTEAGTTPGALCGSVHCTSTQDCVSDACMARCTSYNTELTATCSCRNQECLAGSYCSPIGCKPIERCVNASISLTGPCTAGGATCPVNTYVVNNTCHCPVSSPLSAECYCKKTKCSPTDKVCTFDQACKTITACTLEAMSYGLCNCNSSVYCKAGQSCYPPVCIDNLFCAADERTLTSSCRCFAEADDCGAGKVCSAVHGCTYPAVPRLEYDSVQWAHVDGDVPRLASIFNLKIEGLGLQDGPGPYIDGASAGGFLFSAEHGLIYPHGLPNMCQFHGRGEKTNPYADITCKSGFNADATCSDILVLECFTSCQQYQDGECIRPYCHGQCVADVCVCDYEITLPDGEIKKMDIFSGEMCENTVCQCLYGQVCEYDAVTLFHKCKTNRSDDKNPPGFDDVCNQGCPEDSFDCRKRRCSDHGYCFGQQCVVQDSAVYILSFQNYYLASRPDIGQCYDRPNENAHNYNGNGITTIGFTCFSCKQAMASGWSCDICSDYTMHLNSQGYCFERQDLPNWCFINTSLTVDDLAEDEKYRYQNSISGVPITEENKDATNIHRNYTIWPDKINAHYFCFECQNNGSNAYALIDNICYLRCTEGYCQYGECYHLNRNKEIAPLALYNYFCLKDSCVCDEQDEMGVCISGKKYATDYSERQKCVIDLGDLNGLCYYVNGYHKCLCNEGVTDENGTIIVPGYYYKLKNCYERCYPDFSFDGIRPICWFGSCYFYEDKTTYFCDTCTTNALGQTCAVCQTGQVQDNHTCYELTGYPNQCYNNVALSDPNYCVECAEGYVLYKNKCLTQCMSGSCRNGRCFYIDATNTTYNCTNCFDGHLSITEGLFIRCYTIIDNYYGDCYVTDAGQTICSCYSGFSGALCNIFDGIFIEDVAYLRDTSHAGDCYHSYLDPTIVVCKSCANGYRLPYCDRCAEGYKEDAVGKCTRCYGDYVMSETLADIALVTKIGSGRCVMRINIFQSGTCYYYMGDIVCTSCYAGYDIRKNCEACLPGNARIGSVCVQQQWGCGNAIVAGQPIRLCPGCEQNLSYSCDRCRSQLVNVSGRCLYRTLIVSGDCADDDGKIICVGQNLCLEGVVNATDSRRLDCHVCQTGYLAANGSCHQQVSASGSYYHGECYQEQLYDREIVCLRCDENWTGLLCNTCVSGMTYCDCDASGATQCCCPIRDRKSGVCFTDYVGQLRCAQCLKGYAMQGQICVKQKQKPLFLIWVGLILVIIAVIIVLVVYYYRLSSFQQFRVRRRVKFVLKSAGMYVLYTVLAQICSLIIAIQDVYINSVGFQFAVFFYASIPFAAVFFALQLPKRRHFFFKKKLDALKFAIAASTDIIFNICLYYGIPDQLGVGQAIFKAMVAPACLLSFVFFSGYRFARTQVWCALSAAVVPTIYQLYSSIAGAASPGFFQGLSAADILLGVVLIIVDIVVLTVQMYVFEVVLDVYDEVEALLLVSTFQFVFYGIISTFYMQEQIAVIHDVGFVVCVITQIMQNILQIFIMAGISSIEFAINCVSSAVWVEMISAIGTMIVSTQAGNAHGLDDVIITVLVFIFVLGCLVAFSASHNPMLSAEEPEEGDHEDNGVRSALSKGKFDDQIPHAPTMSTTYLQQVVKGIKEKIQKRKAKGPDAKRQNAQKKLQARNEPKQLVLEELLVNLTSVQNFVLKPVRSNVRLLNVDNEGPQNNLLDQK